MESQLIPEDLEIIYARRNSMTPLRHTSSVTILSKLSPGDWIYKFESHSKKRGFLRAICGAGSVWCIANVNSHFLTEYGNPKGANLYDQFGYQWQEKSIPKGAYCRYVTNIPPTILSMATAYRYLLHEALPPRLKPWPKVIHCPLQQPSSPGEYCVQSVLEVGIESLYISTHSVMLRDCLMFARRSSHGRNIQCKYQHHVTLETSTDNHG